jgi:hypothetical protein
MGNILQFPQRNKGRIRKSTGPWSEGAFAMFRLDKHPANVELFEKAAADECVGTADLALYLAALALQYSPELRETVTRRVLIDRSLGKSRSGRLRAVAAAEILAPQDDEGAWHGEPTGHGRAFGPSHPSA